MWPLPIPRLFLVSVSIFKTASAANIQGALYKLHTEPAERRTSSRTMVRLKDGAALLTCGYSVGDTGFELV